MDDTQLIGRQVQGPGTVGTGLTEAELSEILGTQEVRVLPEGSIVTMDYRPDRARVWHDRNMKIVLVTRG